jgi:hypothetical protein
VKLETSIALLEMLAGGPGSGCHGPNCGRPAGRYVKQQFTTPGGVRVTMLKPSLRQGKRPINPMKRKHPLKGEFAKLEKHYGAAEARPGQKLRTWTSDALGQSGHGTTLFVHKYVNNKTNKPSEIVVDEHNWQGHRWRYGSPTRYSFKNPGRAMGYIKRRYGLSVPLREWRG